MSGKRVPNTCAYCGKEYQARAARLAIGLNRFCSQSCGAHVSKNKKHGQSRLDGTYRRGREYRSWIGMKERCLNTNFHAYPKYGGRGITICDRWMHSFENFLADMGSRPAGCSIDRIDNDGNYEPANCKWATRLEQSRNRSISYTPEQDALIREAIARGYTFNEMAAFVGKSRTSVSMRTYRLGLKSGRPPEPKKEKAA
jgi:hypothetical protein